MSQIQFPTRGLHLTSNLLSVTLQNAFLNPIKFSLSLRTELEDVAWVNLLFSFSPAGGALQSSL